MQSLLSAKNAYTKAWANGPADMTQVSVCWYEAAAYCRWLSEQEGVPEDQMCYPPIAKITEGMQLPEDYLERTGYRLPSEAEWSMPAAAAPCLGATTARPKSCCPNTGGIRPIRIDRSSMPAS